MNISVVICTRNEGKRIRSCLEGVYSCKPDEVIIVDGGSDDNTLDIAREFADVTVIESKDSNLTRDRQIGIDAARNRYIAMIDADHYLISSDLDSLFAEMNEFKLHIIQGGLVAYNKTGFWLVAESDSWELTHNVPGCRKMIGTAPAIYDKRVFDLVRFEETITQSIDDTDFMYRLSRYPEIRVGVGRTKIQQHHFGDFYTYVNKFKWYGKGDGEFCKKHPERCLSMLFHLLIRYPIMYSFAAIKVCKFRVVLFYVLQGYVRFWGLLNYFIR